jgi:hypothetical protein
MHNPHGTTIIGVLTVVLTASLSAQEVLFDFDNAPLHSSLPLDQTSGGITAHLSATGQGYSVQEANVLGFTPQGLVGRVIYPNSISLADLLVRIDQPLIRFSIMYSPQELGCDNSATMRVTAYLNGSVVGTNTKTASIPGTWPVDTLSCSFPQGFDSIAIHYDSRPPTCQDYGMIFMVDNMRVVPKSTSDVSENELLATFTLLQNFPNPFNPSTTISYRLPTQCHVTLKVVDALGRDVATLVNTVQEPGEKSVMFDATRVASGLYYYRLKAGTFVDTKKLLVLR